MGILLLLTLTILAVSGLAAAVLELRMAGNVQYQERAFQAAEYAIERALASPDLGTNYTYSSPKVVPASGSPPSVPGSPPDTYAYRMYYDAALGGTPLPGHAGAGSGLEADPLHRCPDYPIEPEVTPQGNAEGEPRGS